MVAAVAHLVFLATTFPELYSQELDEAPKKAKLYVMQTPVFKPKPLEPEIIPQKRALKVPVPDPEPHDPEPFVVDLEPPPELDIELDSDVVFNVPAAPPAPEPEDKLYRVGEVAAPERTHYVNPQYTEMARRARIEGYVIVEAIISKNGDVVDAKVLKSLPMGLADEAVKALRQWRYKPSTLDGRPVDVLLSVTVNFRLQ